MTIVDANGTSNFRASTATELRKRLNDNDCIVIAPGVFDGLSARTALECGFDCLYMVRGRQCDGLSDDLLIG